MAGEPKKFDFKKTWNDTVKVTKTVALVGAVGAAASVGALKNAPDADTAQAALAARGYTDITTGYAGAFSGAARTDSVPGFDPRTALLEDNRPTAFAATNSDGQRVEGVVTFNSPRFFTRDVEAVISAHSPTTTEKVATQIALPKIGG